MDHKNSNKALAFSLSVLFHAAFVCTAAFLPLYLSQQDPKNVNELEVALVSDGVAPETGAPALEQIEMPAPAQAAAAVVPAAKAEVKVTRTITPIAAPVPVAKSTTVPSPKPKPVQQAPKRVMVAEKAPAFPAQEEESQPVIEVGESLNEDGVNTIEQAEEEAPASTAATETAAPTAAAPIATAPQAAPATAPAATPQTGGQNGTSDQPVASAAKPQNFLTLKQAAGNRPPTYPRDARMQKAEGKGQLAYYVSKDGKVTDIKVNKSSGVQALDEAALAAFSKYKFVPGQEGHTLHNFEFTLQGPAEQDGLKLRTTYQETEKASRPATLR